MGGEAWKNRTELLATIVQLAILASLEGVAQVKRIAVDNIVANSEENQGEAVDIDSLAVQSVAVTSTTKVSMFSKGTIV